MSDTAQGSREGSRFGPYSLKRLLASARTGAVYEALDTVNDSTVALKLLSPTLSGDPDFRERMQRDLRAAERLNEPHLVPINDHGEIDGEWFVDTRLIDGVDLAQLIRESRELAPPRAVSVVGQIATALDTLHDAGIEHRDATPRNILVTGDDFAYLDGLGVAETVAPGMVSPADNSVERWKYIAPEQLDDSETNYQVDVYALACVLYECLTGWPPYRADDAEKLVAAHLSSPIPRPSQLRPDVPPGFDEVIAVGMAKDPRQRYATTGDLAAAAYRALTRADQGAVRHFTPPLSALRTPPGAPPPPQQPYSDLPPRPVSAPHFPPAPPPLPPGYPAAPPTRHAPPYPPPGSPWPAELGPPRFPYRPPRDGRRRRLVFGAVATVVVLAAGGVGLHFLLQPSDSTPAEPVPKTPTESTTTTTPTTPPAVAEARLVGQLPGGYAPDVCQPTPAPKNALAQASCGPNTDPDGPPSATYTVYPDAKTLRAAFDQAVPANAIVICPGRIQSPGPWRHVASPDTPAGMVLCAVPQGNPTLTWTNDAEFMLSTVQANVPGPTIDQLFAWWSSHS